MIRDMIQNVTISVALRQSLCVGRCGTVAMGRSLLVIVEWSLCVGRVAVGRSLSIFLYQLLSVGHFGTVALGQSWWVGRFMDGSFMGRCYR